MNFGNLQKITRIVLYDAYWFLTLCGLDSQLKETSGLSSLKYLLPIYNGLFQGCKGPTVVVSSIRSYEQSH